MIGLLQRVGHAAVSIDHGSVAHIGRGLLVLVGIEKHDRETAAQRLLERLCNYRVFPDTDGRMNRSLIDVGGGLLLVPQFTLAADTRTGSRPGFSTAAAPADDERLFNFLLERAQKLAEEHDLSFGHGRFGADMQISLTNDGPVTFWLQT